MSELHGIPLRGPAPHGIPLDAARTNARAVDGSLRPEPATPGAPQPSRAAARPLSAAPAADPHTALRRLANELESVFLNQLFQAMRESVPQDEESGANPGEELFTSLLDQRLAGVASQRMERGIGDALYRQLARRLAADGVTDDPRTMDKSLEIPTTRTSEARPPGPALERPSRRGNENGIDS